MVVAAPSPVLHRLLGLADAAGSCPWRPLTRRQGQLPVSVRPSVFSHLLQRHVRRTKTRETAFDDAIGQQITRSLTCRYWDESRSLRIHRPHIVRSVAGPNQLPVNAFKAAECRNCYPSRCRRHRLAPCLPSSSRAMTFLWTSSGPSANRTARAVVQAAESGKSLDIPAPPWIWMAKSMTC